MENSEAALLAINHRAVYDLKRNKYVWVNKLIYWGDELMVLGYGTQYKASEYGKSWRLSGNAESEEKNDLLRKLEQWFGKKEEK